MIFIRIFEFNSHPPLWFRAIALASSAAIYSTLVKSELVKNKQRFPEHGIVKFHLIFDKFGILTDCNVEQKHISYSLNFERAPEEWDWPLRVPASESNPQILQNEGR